MQASKRLVVVAAAVAAVSQSGLTARAANVLWDGGGTDSSLLNPANWVGDVLPVPADSAQFTGGVRLDPFAPSNVSYASLFFLAGATGPFTIGGPGTITITGTGNVLNNDTVGIGHTFNANVAMQGGTINATQGALTFNGNLSLGNGGSVAANNVTINAPLVGTVTLNTISGAGTATTAGGALTKVGAGLLNITGSNAGWQGNVFINGGALRINSADGLGGGGRIETALSSGGTGLGTLELDGANYTLNKPVTVRSRGGATANEIAIRNVTGNHAIANVATGSGGNQWNFDSLAGNLAINALNTTATGGNRIVRMSGAGNGEFINWTPNTGTGATANALTLLKEGAGTWTIRSSFVNPATVGTGTLGNITVNGGNLVLEAGVGEKVTGNGLTNPVTVPNVTINSGGTLTVVSADGVSGEVGNYATPTTLTVRAGGTLDASTFSTYNLQVGQTFIGAGTVKAGLFNTYGDNSIFVGDTNATGSVGTLAFQGNFGISNEFATANSGIRFDLAATNTVGGGVNDLITVAGDLLVNNAGGPVKFVINPLTGSLQTGQYRLIDFGTGTTLNPADFTLTGVTAGTTRQSFGITTAPGQVNLTVSGAPANIVWKGNLSADWDVVATSNWLNGAAADKYYQFDNVTFDDTATTRTVNLTTGLTPSSVTVNANTDYVFNGTGSLTTTLGLTKSGTGKLTIANTGPNVLTGGVTINAGTLEIGAGGVEGSIGAVPVTNNGTLTANSSMAVVVGVVGGTGNVVVNGTGGMAFNNANTYTGTTTLNAGASTISNAAGLGDATGGTTINPGATAYFVTTATYAEPIIVSGDGNTAANGAMRAGGGQPSTFTAPLTLAGNTTFRADSGASLIFQQAATGSNTTVTVTGDANGQIVFDGGVSLGTGGIAKDGAATIVLANTGDGSYSGATTVNGGILQLGSATAGGNIPASSTLTMADGTTLRFGSSQTIDFSKSLTGNVIIQQGNNGGTTTLSGNLTGFTGTLTTQGLATNPLTPPVAPSGTLIVATATNASVVTVSDSGGGSGAGVIRLANSNAISPTATINIQAQQAVGIGRLELGNNVSITAGTINLNQKNTFPGLIVADLTPSILSADGTNSLTGNIVAQTGGTYATLGVNEGSTFTVNGTIKPLATAVSPRILHLKGAGTGIVNAVISNDTQAIGVIKTGAGTWTLNGANTYTGANTIVAGTLVLGTAAQEPVLGGATVLAPNGIDIQGGKVAFKYVGDASSLMAQVGSTLDAGYDLAPKFSTGLLRSTALAAGRLLGWNNNVATSQVEVAYTLPGDADLSFKVDFNDLLALAQNYNGTGKVWYQGDFDYNGGVDFNDLLSLAQNYNQTLSLDQQAALGSDFSADFALALSLVPEPTSLTALGMGAMLLRRRRHA
jgi:fibronectin-binding autotransporter adhesin